MELPAYHTPAVSNVSLRAIERCKAFVQKAGTVIFLACALIWFLQSHDWSMTYLDEDHAEATASTEEGSATLPIEKSMLAGIGGMILLFPVSIFWAVLFGFWLPGLAAMQTLFPVLRQEYSVQVRTIPRPTAPDKPLTAQEQKKRSHANWWYYNWGIVAVAAMVIVGVAYVAHGLLTTVDPDYTVAVVTAEALPDEAVQHLQTALADYAEDANGDGAVIVQVNNYTWSADAALTDMNGQMAGATQMNTDLANGESKIWILDDPEGFEQAYGALSEKLGADWQAKLIPWSSQPALSGLELGSYNTAADGSQTVDIQSRFAGYSVAVFDASDALWQALNS